MQNLKALMAVLLGTLALILGVGWFFSWQTSKVTQKAEQVVAEEKLLGENPHIKGATESARFTIVEFSDFQCPGCAVYSGPVESLVEQYPQDVRLVYRHFPLINIHPNAVPAARAAESAALQGRFWEMHDRLFATQKDWEKLSDPTEHFVSLARELSLNEVEFRAGLQNEVVITRVNADLQLALELQLPGTPSFYLNGKLMDLSAIDQQLRAELGSSSTQ